MPFNLGFGEILVILVVALLVFGGRLPEVAKSMGQGIRQFKEGLKSGADPESDEDEEAEGEGDALDRTAVAREESE